MIRVTVESAQGLSIAHHYKIAGRRVVFQGHPEKIAHFHVEPATKKYSDILKRFSANCQFNFDGAECVYEAVAPFGGGQHTISFWRKNDLARIDLDGEPACAISISEQHIHLLRSTEFDEVNLELITGPALIFLLNLRDLYCLHASAVTTKAGNVAFIGESGVGKSTLANRNGDGWMPIADDILPVQVMNDATVELLTDFPQLKCPDSNVYKGNKSFMTLDWVIRISDEPSDKLRFRKLPRLPAMLQIVRHTVAARLFDIDAVRKHAEFAKAMSLHLPVYEIKYPRDMDALDNLRLKIVKHLLKVKSETSQD